MRVDYNTLYYEENEQIAKICLNTPPGNQMTPEFLVEIAEVINKYALKTSAKGIIIAGQGRNFSSGADIDKLLQALKDSVTFDGDDCIVPEWYIEVKEAFDNLYHSDKLVIAAIRGCCLGSGLELALSSHIRIAERGALIGLPEVTFGLVPGMCGTLRMAEELGPQKAFEYILSGELVRVETEEDYPVVDMVVDKRASMRVAEELIGLHEECGEKDAKALVEKYKNSIGR